MKRINKLFVISITSILFLSGMLVAAADCICISLPDSPVTLLALDGEDSYFDIHLSDVPSGFDVSNGWYLGWCIDRSIHMPRNEPHDVMLYCSNDPNIANLYINNEMNKINHVLNNKLGDKDDIQDALWYFVGDRSYAEITSTAQMLVDAAEADFCPEAGEILAILADGGESIQRTIFEFRLLDFEGLTPGFWKRHLCEWSDYIDINCEPQRQFIGHIDTLEEAGFVIPGGKMLDDYRNDKLDREVDEDDSLLDALKYKGGKGLAGTAQTLLRAASAALLNAASDDVFYPITRQGIIDQVNEALESKNRDTMLDLKDELDKYNNFGTD